MNIRLIEIEQRIFTSGDSKMINKRFIEKWSSIDLEEYKYEYVKKLVEKDIKTKKSISEFTFRAILKWKAKRARGYLEENYEQYFKTFKEVLELPNNDKIEKLITLEGIGVLLASTILHFIYPNEFPIIDKRTIDMLQYKDCIDKNISRESVKGDVNRYYYYRSIILNLSELYKLSLRQIEKALSKYHNLFESKIDYKLKTSKFYRENIF